MSKKVLSKFWFVPWLVASLIALSFFQQSAPSPSLPPSNGNGPSPPPSAPWIPLDAQLFLKGDFSETELIDGKLTGWPPHWVSRPSDTGFSTEIYHSSSRSLTLTYGEKTDYDLPNRPDVVIYLSYREIWVSAWYYFPADFSVVNWFGFAMFAEYDVALPNFPIAGSFTINDALEHYFNIHDFPDWGSRRYILPHTSLGKIPLGKWMNIRWHMIRDSTDGLVEIWIDDDVEPRLVFHGKTFGEDSWTEGIEKMILCVFDHYSDVGNPVTTVYYDDVEIWVKT